MRARFLTCAWLVLAACVVAAVPVLSLAGRQYAYAVIGLGSAAAVVAGVRRGRLSRPRAWLLLAAGLGCQATANLVWAVEFSLHAPGDPRMPGVEVLYYTMYPLLAAGLAVLPERPPGTSGWTGMTEAGIVACTGAILAWITLYGPYIVDRGHVLIPGAVTYLLLDLLLIAMAVRLLVVQRRLTATHVLLTAMTVLLTTADVSYFVSVALGGPWSGPALSVMAWLAAFALPGAAALHPAASARPAPHDTVDGSCRTVVLHGLLILVGPATTCYALIRDFEAGTLDRYDFVVPLSATALIGLLLIIRMTCAQRQLRRHAVSLAGALTAQAALQESLRHLTEHDALTGLPNRRMLENRIAERTAQGLLLLDLDGFQDVNDRLGHQIGDELLLTVAARLRTVVAPGELAARTGGDEFALLVPGADAATAMVRAEAVRQVMREPVPVRGNTLHVTASIGVRAADGTTDPARLFGDADLAMNAAKAAGKDCVTAYEAELRDRQTERIRIVERLRRALRDDEFTVHYQPIVDLGTSRRVAVEALVRWLPPGEAPIGPDRFIPAAEDSGLIVELGERVLRRACFDAVPWYRRDGVTLTVNVSPRQLTDAAFATKVRRSLTDSGLPAAALTLEITEGILVGAGNQSAQALAHLETLRADGVRIAVDDFGTGYSSLAYLRDLPIDVLKIDRSLMPAGDADDRQTALVRAVVELARSLRLTTVAEGIETPFQADLLRRLGCERGQGFHYARPMPAADLGAELLPAG